MCLESVILDSADRIISVTQKTLLTALSEEYKVSLWPVQGESQKYIKKFNWKSL